MTWWTRHDKPEPDLSDDEEEVDKEAKAFEKDRDGIGGMEIADSNYIREEHSSKFHMYYFAVPICLEMSDDVQLSRLVHLNRIQVLGLKF